LSAGRGLREKERTVIHEVRGDILKTSAPVLVHGVAPNDDFHSGLALTLRQHYPSMYADFRHFVRTNHPEPGTMWVWSGMSEYGPIRIIALLTQSGELLHGAKPGPAKIEYVTKALKALAKWIKAERPEGVAVPKLATGVGALPWAEVQPAIAQALGTLGVPIYVYSTYAKGVEADEPAEVASLR
jgi:O-acetyl-ADP-ribose deacetylase (regulator of RNase III)